LLHYPYYKTMPKNIISSYLQLKEKHIQEHAVLSKKHNIITALRLLVAAGFIACMYFYFTAGQMITLYCGIAALALFLILMKLNQKIAWDKNFSKNLIRINNEELSFLNREHIPFEGGSEYQDATHAYASDLDLFGRKSLFQHLNRTGTRMGKDQLANLMVSLQSKETIKSNQEAIQELQPAINWRQELLAMARITADSREIYNTLLQWSRTKEKRLPKFLLVLAWILPVALIACLILYAFTRNELYWNLSTKLVPVNLVVIATQLKKVKSAVAGTDKIDEILKQYAAMIERIERSAFKSTAIEQLRTRLLATNNNASKQVRNLSSIYRSMETVQNPFGALILNGLFLYHIHALNSLHRWKAAYASFIPEWLDIIGTMEAFSSLANFSYNNPGFAFPELNSTYDIAFKDLGHPLIEEGQRICNDVSFTDHNFIILTGSNMSGKSTFLRTLGVNMVLAGMGSAVCAEAASLHPLQILVSMRQSDSLADSESYFFAEVKRLKFIIDHLDKEVCFVLLDEILRGTNSDDKRSGTIGVIEKIIRKKAIGAIATHDLEVCLTTAAHPENLVNKCFEVEIINDELCFDYKLRDGICKNKSATFLMQKMEII
jgi:DNA mismatch repair ATPase MutS